MNTNAIRRKLRVCKRCTYQCADCPYALVCDKQGRRVTPVECYVCWHNQGTALPGDCHLRRVPLRAKVRT